MKKYLVLIVLSFVSTISFAAERAFDLKIDMKLHGQKAEAIELTIEEGKIQTIVREINNEKTFIDVMAAEESITEEGLSNVGIKFNVGKIDKEGKRIVLSSPRFVTPEYEMASMIQKDDKGKEIINISVTANEVLN